MKKSLDNPESDKFRKDDVVEADITDKLQKVSKTQLQGKKKKTNKIIIIATVLMVVVILITLLRTVLRFF